MSYFPPETTGGYSFWHEKSGTYQFLDSFYLNGKFFACLPEEDNPYGEQDVEGAVILVGLDGSGIIQVPFRGDAAPLNLDRKSFSFGFLVDSEDDFIALQFAKAAGEPVPFCSGSWVTEMFPATAGQTYSLSRPSADSVLPSMPGVDLTPKIYLEGERSDGSASVVGSRVTALATGRIGVYYMPVYYVGFTSLSKTLQAYNNFVIQAEIVEVGISNFG